MTDDIVKQLKIKTQENLEKAILKYQDALLTDNKWAIDKSYKEICKIYPPYLHMQEWWNQYHYLYDSQEDFAQDYIRIFCNVPILLLEDLFWCKQVGSQQANLIFFYTKTLFF